MSSAPASLGFGQVSPADLALPPTEPIDITALVAEHFAGARTDGVRAEST